MMRGFDRFFFVVSFVPLAFACGSDADSTSSETGSPVSSADDGSGSSGVDEGSTSGDSEGIDSWGEGELRGIVTFTFYPEDPLSPSFVGFAGAWRNTASGFDDVDDFFALQALQTTFPPPPNEADELEHNGVPTPFDWGRPDDWLRAGNGIKLVADGVEALACLLMVGDEYPVYVASHSPLQSEACRPDVESWRPETTYDLVLHGGDLFETNVLPDQVVTPPAVDVLAPDLGQFNARVPIDADLDVRWSDNAQPGTRIVIRMFDEFGRMFTIHASDDGRYTIPATALSVLHPGPVTITLARERVDDVPSSDGVVKVVTRYEHWGYLELQ